MRLFWGRIGRKLIRSESFSFLSLNLAERVRARFFVCCSFVERIPRRTRLLSQGRRCAAALALALATLVSRARARAGLESPSPIPSQSSRALFLCSAPYSYSSSSSSVLCPMPRPSCVLLSVHGVSASLAAHPHAQLHSIALCSSLSRLVASADCHSCWRWHSDWHTKRDMAASASLVHAASHIACSFLSFSSCRTFPSHSPSGRQCVPNCSSDAMQSRLSPAASASDSASDAVPEYTPLVSLVLSSLHCARATIYARALLQWPIPSPSIFLATGAEHTVQ